MIQRPPPDPLADLFEPAPRRVAVETAASEVVRSVRSRPKESPVDAPAAPPLATAAAIRPGNPVRRQVLALLSSPSGLRQAWLLHEILGLPRALSGPGDRGPRA